MDYFKGYGYIITPLNGKFQYIITLNGNFCLDGNSTTHNGALTAMRRNVNMFLG